MIKDGKERRKELLNIAGNLFISKGFDNTSITDILNEAGIARGTLYYYFKSKEEIMDAIIEEYTEKIVIDANSIAKRKDIGVLEKFFLIIGSMNMKREGKEDIIEYIHRPQNALMNEKINRIIVDKITPILSKVVLQGVKEGIFSTKYSYEAVEIILVYSIHSFGYEFMAKTDDEKIKKIKAFLYSIERLFGAKEGTFDVLEEMIYGEINE